MNHYTLGYSRALAAAGLIKTAGILSNAAKRTAVGAGIGGGIGGTAGYMSGEDPNMLGRGGTRGRNMLIGALGGAAAGGGIGRWGLKGAIGKADEAVDAVQGARRGGTPDRQLNQQVQQLDLFSPQNKKRVQAHNQPQQMSLF